METRTLPVKLTRDELDQRRDQLASTWSEIVGAEQAKTDAASFAAKQIKELKSTAGGIVREIREKAEHRIVECEWATNDERGVKDLVRQDTGEVVETRQLRPEDRQATLFAIKGKKPKGETQDADQGAE